MTKSKVFFGFYSLKAEIARKNSIEKKYTNRTKNQLKKDLGYTLYQTPNGEIVKVNAIVRDKKEIKSYNWDDIVFVGEVVHCVQDIYGNKLVF